MLIALQNGVRVEATFADRDGIFACPNCSAAATLKRGAIKIAHFAHKPPVTCAWGARETELHLRAKTLLRDSFVRRGFASDVELPVLSSGGDRRADVAVWTPGVANLLAIEVQHQPISYGAIERRTLAYQAANVPVIWLGVLASDKIGKAEAVPGGIKLAKYTVKPWEKWAHALSMGELWFIEPEAGRMWKGKFQAHMIHVESSSWYENGEEQSAGGYSRYSKRWRDLILEGPIEMDNINLELFSRKNWTSKEFTVPAGRFGRFTKG